MRNISLICMSQGNPEALRRTFESVQGVCDEIIYGDVIMLPEVRELIYDVAKKYNCKVVNYKFDTIYKNGFSYILNDLSKHATNDLVLYLNCGEIIQKPEQVIRLVNEKFSEYNTFAMRHDSDPHVWWRLYDRNKVKWQGIIHEELRGERIDCPYFLFTFEDTQKDVSNPLHSKVADDTKELCYFKQYTRLIETPEVRTIENEWWLNFAKENFDSMKHRLFDKRERYEAFEEGKLEKYLHDVYSNPLFEKERFESNTLIEYQNSNRSL